MGEIPSTKSYLRDTIEALRLPWPDNLTCNIVFHGHSVPAGYFKTPMVDSFNAYPHLVHQGLKARYPNAIINPIITAVGGEHSIRGWERFKRDVISHRPVVVVIDYALNDRGLYMPDVQASWRNMIEESIKNRFQIILMTPTHDDSSLKEETKEKWDQLVEQTEQIRQLAKEYQIGLGDSFAVFEEYIQTTGSVTDLLSQSNHPNRKGHELVAREILKWFIPE